MPSLPPSIVTILAPFTILFCKSKTWSKALTLLVGAIICRGGRTVCSVLRIMGLKGERAFQNYHCILNRAKWNSHQGSKTLLEMLIDPNKPILIGMDEYIERRNGKKIKAKRCYREAVRSSKNFIVCCFGLKWISMIVIKRFSWSPRTFALPFLTALAALQNLFKIDQNSLILNKFMVGSNQASNFIFWRCNILQLFLPWSFANSTGSSTPDPSFNHLKEARARHLRNKGFAFFSRSRKTFLSPLIAEFSSRRWTVWQRGQLHL